jgi:FkbM family methyltransferase
MEARRALITAKDLRFLMPFLSKRLLEAARRWVSALPPGFQPRTILDVGANLGNVAQELCDLYHPAFIGLVEANPELTPTLEELDLHVPTQLFPCALGHEPSRLPFNIVQKGESSNVASSSLLPLSQQASLLWRLKTVRTIEVPVRTLDDVWSECGLSLLDLLKIDVQGYEPKVLMGGPHTMAHTRVLVIEMSFIPEYEGQWLFGQLYDYLHDNGFELSATFEFARNSQGTPLQCNGVFINTRLIEPPSTER